MAETSPQPETINRLFNAVYPSFAMLAGMELDLFTPLEAGSLSVEQLAGELDVLSVKLRPLLNVLVVAGLLLVKDDVFSNTPEASHYLVRGKPDYLGGMWELTQGNWARILKTAKTIRNGGPLAEFDYHSTQDELVALFRGLYPGTVVDAQRLMERYDFSAHKTLLDVGGGSGGLAITFAKAHPQLKATVLDLPSITPITQKFVAEAELSHRIDIVEGNAVSDTLSGSYDVVIARHLIQVFSEEEGRSVLSNIATIVKPGGVIHLLGWILDDSRLAPENIVGYNLVLLNAYADGQAYTEAEYFSWLGDAGFVDCERVTMQDGASIIMARKPE